MELKPQELLILFKVAAHPQRQWTYSSLAGELFLSPAEVHASVRRAVAAGLAVSVDRRRWTPVGPALLEFSVHGARYAYPAEIGAIKRGIPTAFGAGPLAQLIASGAEEAPVWAHPRGTARGPAVSPIYRTAPQAALADPALYQMLALLDALRIGRARERTLAGKLLGERLNLTDAT